MPRKAHKPGPLHRSLRLQHHRHTGHKLTHKHTSYHGLAIVFLLAGLFIVGLNMMAKATADTIRVTGKVSAPIPTEPAVITNPTTGPVARPSITVSGTCPILTPAVIVVLAVDNNEVGSAICDDGTFSIPILIMPGHHTLVARLYNITDDRGPDSEPVHISYTLPTPPSSGGGPHNQPNKFIPGFIFQQSRPFVVFGPTKLAVWTGIFNGGVPPYHVHISWGDGSTNDYVLDGPGEHDFTHRYSAMKPHEIVITASDSDGREQIGQYVAVTPYRTPTPLLSLGPRGPEWPGAGKLILIYSTYLLMLLIFAYLWKQRREFAYAPVPAPRPFVHRYNRAYLASSLRKKRRHR